MAALVFQHDHKGHPDQWFIFDDKHSASRCHLVGLTSTEFRKRAMQRSLHEKTVTWAIARFLLRYDDGAKKMPER